MEASSGYRPGGQNIPLPQGLQTSQNVATSFGADTLWNYEIGVKSELFDKRLSFDADAFHRSIGATSSCSRTNGNSRRS